MVSLHATTVRRRAPSGRQRSESRQRRVDGLASQVVLAAGASASLLYLGALAAGIWAAFESVWWLVAVAAVAGRVGCALGARHWWHAYRHDPAAHTRGASPRLLGALAVLACLGFATLLVFS